MGRQAAIFGSFISFQVIVLFAYIIMPSPFSVCCACTRCSEFLVKFTVIFQQKTTKSRPKSYSTDDEEDTQQNPGKETGQLYR